MFSIQRTLLLALLVCCTSVFCEEITIDSCANRQQQNATFTHDGENTLHIRKLNDILQFTCTIQVKSQSESQINTVIVHADELNMALTWLFNEKSLMIEAQAGRSLQIVYSRVDRFILDVGGTDNSVQFVVGALNTETVINFPNNSLEETRNTLTVVGGKQGVLATGTIKEVRIGIFESNSLPFEYFNSVLGLSGDIGRVLIDTGSTSAAPQQNYVLGKTCLYEKHRPSNETVGVSDWLMTMFKNNSLVYSNCSVVYNPEANQSLVIRTGGADDTVEAKYFGMKTTLDLAEGADNVTWLYPTEKATLNVNLGIGADTILIHEAASVMLDLGQDQLSDTVTVMYDEVPPSIDQNSFKPIGPYNKTELTLSNWRSDDVVFIRRGLNASVIPSSQPVSVGASVAGSFIYYEISDDMVFRTDLCAADANIVFDAHSAVDSKYSAVNTRVEVGVTTPSVPCHVTFIGVDNANSTAAFVVPENSFDASGIAELRSRSEPSFTGFSSIGRVEFRTEDVEHFEYDMPLAPLMSGTITVDGIPAKTDLLIVMDPKSYWTVQLNSINSNVAIVDCTTIVSQSVFSSGQTVFLYGKEKQSGAQVRIPDSAKDLLLVNGCLNMKEKIPNNTLSKWMMQRLEGIGVDVDPVRSCSVDMTNLTSLRIRNVKHIDVSDLRQSNIDSVAVESEDSLSVTLEPMSLANTSRKWSSLGLYNNDGLIHAEYMNVNDSFKLYVDVNNRADITLGSPMLEDRSRVLVECINSTSFFHWNFSALPINSQKMTVYVNVSNKGLCSGSFSNSVNENQGVMPYMRFGEDIEFSVHTEISNSSISSFEDELIRFVNLTTRMNSRDRYVHGHYMITNVEDPRDFFMDFDWDLSRTDLLELVIKDSIMTTFNISDEVLKVQPYWIYFKGDSRLSFPNQKSPVFFRHSITTKFLYDRRLIALRRKDLPADSSESPNSFDFFRVPTEFNLDDAYDSYFSSDSDTDDDNRGRESMGHCFDPCGDCSEGYWGEVHLSERPCDTRLGRYQCNESARIYLTQLDRKAVLGCGSPEWDNHTNGTCSFVLNDEGTDLVIIYPPYWVQVVVIVLVSLSAFLTIIGASSTFGRLIWKRRRIPGLTAWWARSVFRDLLADQFSWAGIVITASLAEVRDFDYTNWGGPVVAILQMTKHYVLDWFLPCDSCGEPLSISPPLIIFWSATILTTIVRLVFILCERYRQTMKESVENALLVFQALFTSSCFILLPLAGYTIAFVDSASKFGYVSLVLAVLLFVSQPLGEFTIRCAVGVSSSVFVVVVPVILSFISGLGAPRVALLTLSILSVIILPIVDMIVLWTSFFSTDEYRTSKSNQCFKATIALRVISAVCGLVFFVMLAFELNSAASTVAAAFWFLWILLPWFGLITLIIPIPGVLSRPGNQRPKNNEDNFGQDMRVVRRKRKNDDDEEEIPLNNKGGLYRKGFLNKHDEDSFHGDSGL